MAGFIDILRSGAWLSRERMRLVALAVLAASLLGAVFLIVTSNGLNDRFNRPLGTDFSSFYAAGTLVQDGQPAAAFDLAAASCPRTGDLRRRHAVLQLQLSAVLFVLAGAWRCCRYPLALAVWQAASFVFYLLSIRAIVGTSTPGPTIWLLFAAAFPPVFINLGQAHNGFLTAALFGAALVALDRRPVLAGVLFGLMAYKPQFGC